MVRVFVDDATVVLVVVLVSICIADVDIRIGGVDALKGERADDTIGDIDVHIPICIGEVDETAL